VAYDAGYEAHHVNHRGKSGSSDYELVRIALAEELTIVTNNAEDFRRLLSKTDSHPGLVIIIPNVKSEVQRRLFKTALDWMREKSREELVKQVLEVDLVGVRSYEWPLQPQP
jgi:predicted nuclease of predicted toxin-antitoxin system